MKKLKKPAWGGSGTGFAWWLVILLFVAVFLAVQLAEGAVIAAVAFISCRIRVTETRIRSSKLPDAFDGYRIVPVCGGAATA